MPKIPRHKLLSREQKLSAYALLDMLYKPSELADEIGIDKRLVYDRLIPAGLPCTKDKRGRIWLHGLVVAAWARSLKKDVGVKLAPGEAYCFRCREPVRIKNPERVQVGQMTVLSGCCSVCGVTVNRGVKVDKP